MYARYDILETGELKIYSKLYERKETDNAEELWWVKIKEYG